MQLKQPHFLIFFLCLVAIPIITDAQTKGLQEVDVDLGSGSFYGEAGLPFDVPFRIRGAITPSLRSVSVKYRIQSSDFKKRMRFPSKTKDTWSTEAKWTYLDEPAKDQKFRLTVGPLHPNVAYEFKYNITKLPSLNATQREDLKKAIFESLNLFLSDLTNVADSKIATLNDELNKKMKLAAGVGTVVNTDGTSFSLNILDAVLLPTTTAIINSNLNVSNAKVVLVGNANTVTTGKLPAFATLQTTLANINNGTVVLSPAAKIIWDAPVTTAIQSLKELKVSELAALLADPAQLWADVINGKAKIEKGGLTPVAALDNASLSVLTAFFTVLKSGVIKDNASRDIFALQAASINGNFLPAANQSAEQFEIIKNEQQKKADLLAKFPDVLADKLISLSFIIVDKSVSDVVSSSTPYIGLDVGFSYTPGYSQVFAYEGVNFYFVPVNKDAPLKTMKGLWNSLSKRLSVHIGLTQSLIAAENKNYAPLINNVGSLLVGTGIRVSRIVRINYGAILFYEKNPNPLIDKKDLKKMYSLSLTFDLNVAKALGSFGTRLGIK